MDPAMSVPSVRRLVVGHGNTFVEGLFRLVEGLFRLCQVPPEGLAVVCAKSDGGEVLMTNATTSKQCKVIRFASVRIGFLFITYKM